MDVTHQADSCPAAASLGVRRVGCVSYLNAKPLIDGVEALERTRVKFDVPARLLEDLESGQVDLALCPVIDYFRARVPLRIVPVGGIGCQGETLTVRLYSRVPIERVDRVFADSDSHTSVALLQVLFHQIHRRQVAVIPYHAREQVARHRLVEPPATMLLIGDKVVTDSPRAVEYPYQLDLGQAWHDLTGLPFLFAVWMAPEGAALGDLPEQLAAQRQRNAARIDEIVDRYAQAHGWPRDLARQYLGRILRYEVGNPQLQAMERFAAMAQELGLIETTRPLRLWGE